MERPRTHLVEVAVSYLTAKAQATPHPTGFLALPIDAIYAIDMSSGEYGLETSQQDASRFSPTVHHPQNMQFSYSGYQPQQQQINFQQLPRQGPSLHAPQNETQSQQQCVGPQQAPQQAPHSHLLAFGTPDQHWQQQHLGTQHVPQPQASYLQPPWSYGQQQFSDLPQPDMTSMDNSSMPARSINHQSLDTPNPQPQGYSTWNGLDISSDSPWPNTISGDGPSTQIRSLGQQNLDIAQPQHEQNPMADWEIFLKYNPDNYIQE
ncbi:hypothetical protein H9Q72_011997 [Fusarium xylarioides]|uniref:Uncharacterized protein n=1 Tax=Fusarium xylarioides TaxID=221167 RepID=A0A9P7IBM6_9HYPO|nr:hypothetical protein H9Q70_010696 [Fusarium xylarioides]KAG5759881.1 hypothetical protein H9Q72_011997 [Fusarium xylarioides]KAG5778593.1 hypothetical protein H9Q73_007734 [Fusarium xylarioides]KAG5804985.1 hypothetical protein H9Q71_010439 [Fusarium xylarioides]KAG5818189.1 hypothetical protein H9Q74_010189 [Fusarium xylarioides]